MPGVLHVAKWLWAAIAIVAMWMAALFGTIYGGEIVADSTTGHTSVPVGVAIAFFAVFGTLIVARYGFRDGGFDTAPLRAEMEAERERLRALEGELEQLKRDVAELGGGNRAGVDRQAAGSGAHAD